MKKLGEIMVESGLITEAQLGEVLADQQAFGGKLGSLVFEKCLITERDFLEKVGGHLRIPWVDFTEMTIPEAVFRLIPQNVAWDHQVVPVKVYGKDKERELLLAMANPDDFETVEKISQTVKMRVIRALALDASVRHVIMDYYQRHFGKGDYRLEAAITPDQCIENSIESQVYEPVAPRTVIEQEAPAKSKPEPAIEHTRLLTLEQLEGSSEPGENDSSGESVLLGGAGNEDLLRKALIADAISDEHDNFSIELMAFLTLLTRKGLITSEEYLKVLRELKTERFREKMGRKLGKDRAK